MSRKAKSLSALVSRSRNSAFMNDCVEYVDSRSSFAVAEETMIRSPDTVDTYDCETPEAGPATLFTYDCDKVEDLAEAGSALISSGDRQSANALAARVFGLAPDSFRASPPSLELALFFFSMICSILDEWLVILKSVGRKGD